MATKKYDLFVSYADADVEWVEGYLIAALKQAGVNYCSKATFMLGVEKIDAFETAIRESERTLLILSSAYLADPENRFVNSLAQNFGFDTATWPVIPLSLESELKLPTQLRVLIGLDATGREKWEKAIERLCDHLKIDTPKETKIPQCPYPGMRTFEEEDERRFFGRDEEIEDLLRRLRLHPFLTIIGPSGSGKSSLVFAGLIPKLKHSGLFGMGQWCIRKLRPGTNPLATLQDELGGDVNALEVSIQQLLSAQSDVRRLLLVVDQFEELFTQSGTEGIPFQEALLKLMEIPNVYLILTVRADFYAHLMGSLLWEKINLHRADVLPLNKKGLRQAIVRPAEGVNVYIDSALVKGLLVDATGTKEAGFLPFVQETLVLLWEKLERHFLPLIAYDELLFLPNPAYGETATQPQTGLQVAISQRANAAFASLETEEKRAIARRIFLRLVQFSEGLADTRRSDTRRQQTIEALQSKGEDPVSFQNTLNHLVNSRLLTLSGEEKAEKSIKVDLAHEALISGWPTFQQWISEGQDAEKIRRRLNAKAEEWIRLGEGAGGLLDKIELVEAEGWLSSPNASIFGYDESLPRLITASQRMVKQAKAQQFFYRLVGLGFVLMIPITLLSLIFAQFLNLGADFLNNRGYEKFTRGENESALQALDLSLMLNPRNAEALYNRGVIYEDKKTLNLDLAHANYEGAIKVTQEVNPSIKQSFAPAYSNLARLEIIQREDYTKAVDLITEGLKLKTDEGTRYTLFKNLGWAQLKLKNYAQAKANLQKAIDLDRKRGSAYCLFAKVLELNGTNEEALKQWSNCREFGKPYSPEEANWIKEAKLKLRK